MELKKGIKELKENIIAIYFAYKNKETPIFAKVMALLTVGYALSPIDLIPDFIPILGYLDDFIILPLMIYISLKLIPNKIMDVSVEKARKVEKINYHNKWIFAIPIVILWIIIVYFIVKLIFY